VDYLEGVHKNFDVLTLKKKGHTLILFET